MKISCVILIHFLVGLMALKAQQKPNIIIMIGDGMGLAQISYFELQEKDATAFERFQHIGLLKTSSLNKEITDSAAGATAYATGNKVVNKAISVDTANKPLKTIFEIAEENGYQTGIIATSSITHATPAAFFSHQFIRHQEEEIAAQIPTSGLDFFAAGGTRFLADRKDEKNIFKELDNAGYVWDSTELKNLKLTKKKNKMGFLLADDGMPKMTDGRGDFSAKAFDLATDYFENQNEPFILLVEGSQIDWGGHANDTEYIITELADFNRVINKALDYQDDRETLVLVTADHETGAFALRGDDKGEDYTTVVPAFNSGGHTAAMVPVFAEGPGAEKFRGIKENTAVFYLMEELVAGKK